MDSSGSLDCVLVDLLGSLDSAFVDCFGSTGELGMFFVNFHCIIAPFPETKDARSRVQPRSLVKLFCRSFISFHHD